jgi:SAM-dependent methyltransferase
MQESSTKKIYDIHSVFYDATFGRLVKRRIERAINHMNIAETDLVLDLGIGTGVSLNFYPNRGRVIGVDLSAGMLREARKKIRERGLSRASVFQANALELPFADDTFDHARLAERPGVAGPHSPDRRGDRLPLQAREHRLVGDGGDQQQQVRAAGAAALANDRGLAFHGSISLPNHSSPTTWLRGFADEGVGGVVLGLVDRSFRDGLHRRARRRTVASFALAAGCG